LRAALNNAAGARPPPANAALLAEAMATAVVPGPAPVVTAASAKGEAAGVLDQIDRGKDLRLGQRM